MSSDDTLEETTFSIPFKGRNDERRQKNELPIPLDVPSEFPEAQEMRLEAYRRAWGKCLDKMQEIIQQLLEPHVEAVVEKVKDDYTIPGLPQPELPVLSISNPIFGASFLETVCDRLDTPSTHLHPSDCTNITNAMRSIITGLANEGEKVKQRTSLVANYDINYLVAWYKHFVSKREDRPMLVVVLHNFEEFDPVVMQDVFYICSQEIPNLPLSFILSLSTPLQTYLHLSYPRSTLANLRIRYVSLPSGITILNRILSETFFSCTFDPELIVGPKCLEYIADFFIRHNRTLDSLITNVQLVFMKHFSNEPLTCLFFSTPPLNGPTPPSQRLLEAAFGRIAAVDEKILDAEPDEVGERVLKAVEQSREAVKLNYMNTRVAFNLVKLIQEFLGNEGLKGLDGWDVKQNLCKTFAKFMKRDVDRWLKDINRTLKLLSLDRVTRLIARIQDMTDELDEGTALEALQARIENEESDDEPSTIVGDFARAIHEMLRVLLTVEKQPLSEIWNTGNMPFPSELINPSIRASLLAGLLRPLEFTSAFAEKEKTTLEDMTIDDDSLWKLPDTSILFKRYLDSGRMINVYDWFESFQFVLETQRAELAKEARGKGTGAGKKGKGRSVSPKKTAGGSPKKNGKKGEATQPGEDEGEGADEEEMDEEKWKLEVQARFMRALHELDYLGFIKHTKRRADHVIRTVFEPME